VSSNSYTISFIHSFVHPFHSPSYDKSRPLQKQALHRLRSSASSFNSQYPLISIRSSHGCLRLLPRLLVTYLLPSILLSITCFRRQFLPKMWPIKLSFLFFTVCKIFLFSLTLCNIYSHNIDTSDFLHTSTPPHFKTFQIFMEVVTMI